MKNLIRSSVAALLLMGFASCDSNPNPQNNVYVSEAPQQSQQVSVQTAPAEEIPGFDINQFTVLLKTATTPEALTAALNANPNNINNLDLDNNNEIDYLKVSQLDANTLQVVDETATERVTIATLTINQNNQSYSIQGNQDYCGNNYQYHSPTGMTFGQMMFLSYMLQPHRSYYHPYWGYHRGYYSGYHPYRSHYARPYSPGYAASQRTTRTTTTTKVVNQPTKIRATAPPANIRQTPNVSAPTASQKKFNSNEGNRFKNNGGNTNGFKTPTQAARTTSAQPSKRSSFGGGGSRGGGSRGGGSRGGRR